jgi:hypothetical protein
VVPLLMSEFVFTPFHPHLPPKVNDHISVHLGSAPLSVIKY